MGQRGFALLKGAVMELMLVVSAKNMMANQSAIGNGAPRQPNQGEGVASTAAAAQKCARLKAAMPLLVHTVFAASMVHMERARLLAAPLVCHHRVLRTAPDTAETRGRRALLRVAPPPRNARVSAPNTAAVQVLAFSQAAPG